MKHNYKFFMALALVLMLHVSTAFATYVSFSLTTHVDVRTLTAHNTERVNHGTWLRPDWRDDPIDYGNNVNLIDIMSKSLWRANTSYTFYSDAEKTQPITTVGQAAEQATETIEINGVNHVVVYVDYVFDPPFLVSSEGAEFYYNFNAYIGGNKYYLCDDLGGLKSSAAAQYKAHAMWALYGDGYCLNLKAEQTGQWLTYTASAPVMADAPMTTGWQLYLSEYTNNGKVYETVILGTTTENQILHFDNNADAPSSPGIPSSQHSMGRFVLVDMSNWNGLEWDEHHKLIHTSTSYDQLFLSNSSFFFTAGDYQNIYSIIWRIKQADGTWIQSIKQKGTAQARFSMPDDWSDKPYCTYDRYYKDENFTEKYADTDRIPVTGNTYIYVRENLHGELYSDHWITLVLSFDLDGENNRPTLGDWFGTLPNGKPAVRVLEYTALTTNKENTKYALTFTETNVIKKHKPYLFKADEVLVQDGNYLTYFRDGNFYNKPETDLNGYVDEGKVYHNDIHDGVQSPTVTMIGTYLDKVLTTPSNGNHPDLLYFYFGYDKRYDPASSDYVGETEAEGKQMYNFYRVTSKNVTIKPNKCYFMIEGAPAGAKFMLMDNFGNEITSVEGIDADSFIQTTGRIYNLNGQMMGTDLQSLPRGIYIVNGKKVMK